MYFCSMNYNEYKDNFKSFRALTSLTDIPFLHLLPYFKVDHSNPLK